MKVKKQARTAIKIRKRTAIAEFAAIAMLLSAPLMHRGQARIDMAAKKVEVIILKVITIPSGLR